MEQYGSLIQTHMEFLIKSMDFNPTITAQIHLTCGVYSYSSPHQAIRRDDQLTQLTSGTAASPGGDAPLHSTQTTPTLSTVAPNER